MGKWIWLFLILTPLCNAFANNHVRYTEEQPPPGLGWESAIKFFSRSPNSTMSSFSTENMDDSAFFIDQMFVIDNKYATPGITPPKWGLNTGYEWDSTSWYGSGIYINYANFQNAEKFAITGGFYFPRLESGFPLYLRANIGLGYYNDELNNQGATFDYNAGLGWRFYSSDSWLFNLEFGSRNYTRLLKSEAAQSIILSSGIAITF